MKSLKLISKAIGFLILIVFIILLTTFFFVKPQFSVAKTVAQDNTIPHITIDSTIFHSESFGSDTAQVVIAIHGGPGQDYRSLLPLKALGDSFKIVFYDQRGTGLSPRVATNELTLESSISDLDAIIDYYSPDRSVYLIGHSWGAMLASGYIAQHPDKVNKAVLAEPGFLTSETAKTFMERSKGMMPPMTISTVWRMIKAFMESLKVDGPDEEAGMDYLMARIIGMTDIKDHPMARYYCNQQAQPNDKMFWRLSMQASQAIRKTGMNSNGNFEIDLVSGLQKFNHEVLFLTSECNQLIGKDIQEIHMSYFPIASMKIVPNSGHDMIYEQPNESLRIIRQYFAK